MNALTIPEDYNYIAVFLTLGCNLRCPFCINRYGDADQRYPMMSGDQWLAGLNRIVSRPNLPITLQGGEPSLHPDFFSIVNGLRSDLRIDILTNLQFDIEAFMASVPPERVSRDAPYASIRVSYHPGEMALEATVAKVSRMLERGYSIGVWAVDHPGNGPAIDEARRVCTERGIDFRLKEFLGDHEGRLYGSYKYPDGLSRRQHPSVDCRTTELIVGPSGDIFRCHGDLYEGRPGIGHLCHEDFDIDTDFRPCTSFGFCNPCDIKIKTNRFQQFGHTSVDIRGAREAGA
ncbi:MAG: radical SAM protein [Verrucomicrobia bacterium]|jgi:MoaA/NifB/PqqE/SkfB family radical SAM enzyme|nr:radical SAM protein [Verrucomicrobiota bacterium]MBT7068242.1 radical SAM protein [Verrucomicrobiota bacterium]MBT7699622.1 radical SAM protein [Verrucomicrobiota bacterium]